MIYNALGVFIQPPRPNVLFEGFYLKHNKENTALTGRMYDSYGPSAIKGKLDIKKGEMNFIKKYDGSGNEIIYKFKQELDGILWRGKFLFESRFGGEAYCELFLKGEKPEYDWREISAIARMSIEGTERWAEGLTKSIIEKGWFEEIKDEETGKILLKPSDNPLYKID